MGSLRSHSYENDYSTATTNNAFHLAYTWMPVREYLHAHTFIYMQQSVLFAVEVPICAQAFQHV